MKKLSYSAEAAMLLARRRITICTLFIIGMGTLVQAALIDRGTDTLGKHLIYDTDLNITWYDYTRIYDTWYNQMSWAENLTVTMADGQSFTDWRLPTTPGTIWGYTNEGEMGHLYYDELGNAAGGPLTNKGPFIFTDMQSPWYWTESDYGGSAAWVFHFDRGYQDPYYKGGGVQQMAMAVHSGDVPEPATIAFLGIGTLSLIRRKK